MLYKLAPFTLNVKTHNYNTCSYSAFQHQYRCCFRKSLGKKGVAKNCGGTPPSTQEIPPVSVATYTAANTAFKASRSEAAKVSFLEI